MPVREKRHKLFFDFTWRGIRCKEYTGLLDTPENRRRCEAKMRVVDREVARGTFDYREHFPRGSRLHLFYPGENAQTPITFQDYILRWYAHRSPFLPDGQVAAAPEAHPSTWIHDESTIRRHLLPTFGHCTLHEIDPIRCNSFRRALVDTGLSGKSITNITGLLHKALADAVEEGFIDRNPMPRMSRRSIRLAQRRRVLADPFTPDEIMRAATSSPTNLRLC